MSRSSVRRIASVFAAAAVLAVAACSSPTGPSQGGVYGGSGTFTSQLCGGVYGGSGTC